MTTTSASAVTTTPRVSTRTLLAAGLVAGPLYTAVWLGQAATREGFDITRHPASLLANGGPGWIQTANFVIAGILSIAAAVGVRRSITGRGSRWAPRLLGAYGVGLLLAASSRPTRPPVSPPVLRPTTPRSAPAGWATSSPAALGSPASSPRAWCGRALPQYRADRLGPLLHDHRRAVLRRLRRPDGRCR